MKRKRFGSNGPLVSVIGQGTYPLPDRDSLRRGIELGLTHIDTAEMYGDGRSEEIVGGAIAGVPRENLFVVTKVLPQHGRAKEVTRACERSLRRLRTPYVDCYLLHWRGDVPLEETLPAMERLVEQGKARSIGVSNFDPWDLREAAKIVMTGKIACNQILYNLQERTPEDHELPWARDYGCAVVAYTPLGRGLRWDGASKKARVLRDIASAHGVTAQAVALAFLIADPLVFAIPKASRREHLEANAHAAGIDLTDAEKHAIDAAFPRRERTGPLPTN